MSVAIITLYGLSNYGNRLQNYALQQAVRACGADSSTLVIPEKKKNSIRKMIGYFVKRENGKLIRKLPEDRVKEQNIQTRKNVLRVFDQTYLKTISVETERGFFSQELNNVYGTFITGSDQVWNPFFWSKKDPQSQFNNYFLQFAIPEKRIAYAASFGVDALPAEWEEPMAKELNLFKAISVRETSGAAIVKRLTGREVPVVLDPTMLLTAEEWRQLEVQEKHNSEKYVLTYFLGKQSETVQKEVRQTAEALGAQIVEMMDRTSENFLLGPDRFLEMIDQAQAVFTDSFHAVVFSILFHTPFRIFSRRHKTSPDMGSRLDTLLEKTQLIECVRQNRFPSNEEFVQADLLIKIERERSMAYLQNALS